MGLRPVPATWFEVLVLRDDLTVALDVLARSASVELQSHGEAGTPTLMPESRALLEEFDELDRRFGVHWPEPGIEQEATRREPGVMLERAMQQLRGWSADAQDVVERLEELNRSRQDLALLEAMFRDARDPLPDLELITGAGPILKTCLYLLAGDEWPEAMPASLIAQRVVVPDRQFLLAVGLPDDVDALGQQLVLQKARPVALPDDLPPTAEQATAVVRQRLEEIDARIAEAHRELASIHDRHGIVSALSDVEAVRWYVHNVPDLESTEHFAWITGWCREPDGERLLKLLADADVKGLLHMTEPPPGFEPPLLLRNPAWMRPFEAFSGLLGVPGAGEADPTRILAIATPLMFGYMFGDVGHGAVLMIIGILLRRRFPVMRLLIAGGGMSIVFGFLFGSVFALENIMPALWLHPLDHPVLMLTIPMVGGAILLLAGMCLDALQAYWQHRSASWWATVAGLVLCYLALLGSVLEPRLLWLAGFGALWFLAGHALIVPHHRLAALGSATVEFLESVLQLVVNTVSFVRVGAFSLAHAGLAAAVIGVAEAPASAAGRWSILILGNALIIGLEGLVVGIQTTRLVLFEFFVRFLHAEGRPFKPLTAADLSRREHRRS